MAWCLLWAGIDGHVPDHYPGAAASAESGAGRAADRLEETSTAVWKWGIAGQSSIGPAAEVVRGVFRRFCGVMGGTAQEGLQDAALLRY